MKFFQVFTMIVMVLATVGVIGESGRGSTSISRCSRLRAFCIWHLGC